MQNLSKLVFAAIVAVAPASVLAQSAIQIESPWAMATPAGAKAGAAYMMIENKSNEPDRLIGATSEIAKTHQIHEMKVVDGVMRMREIPGGLAISAGGSVTLKPGGYHVMLIGLNKKLNAGDKVDLTLVFQKAGKVMVEVPVKAMDVGRHNMPGMEH